MRRALGGLFAAGALFAGAAAAFMPAAFASGVSYTMEAGDHGPGGWAGGALFADGVATGSGEIAGPDTPGPMHIVLTSWTPDQSMSGYLDVNYTFGPGIPGCVAVPITHGAEQPSPLYLGGSCGDSPYFLDYIPGKATPTG